ncbi:MAG: GIY-YIG nuclease family protein [Patescibacteria group bacterium]|nr:GIY-YIG nuclease family protein [Patescibacteria group bacterium]
MKKMSKTLSKQLKELPDQPGVYLFEKSREILYVGKATSLRSRARSYFGGRIAADRGAKIAAMVEKVTSVDYRLTDSVLEALLLEIELINKHKPPYNTVERDLGGLYHVVITKEDWPAVLLKRGREIREGKFLDIIGPFPNSKEIKEGLKIIRRLFPFRDTCAPGKGKPCFNAQIGLCPGVCAGDISRTDYRKQLRKLRLFLHGRKKQLVALLEKEMKQLAKGQKFEEAELVKRRLFTLQHIRDVAMITSGAEKKAADYRIEAYDVAHLAGVGAVAAMTVWQNGDKRPDLYRRFKLRTTKSGDDYGGLCEVLKRRLDHPEWPYPSLIVVDGGKGQLNVARKIVREMGHEITVVAVTKNERHRAKEIIGNKKLAHEHEAAIILANAESHRFALFYHRKLRHL